MISALLVFGPRGEVLASRIYKDGLRRAVTDVFRVQVIANPESKSPVLTLGSTTFLHIKHNDLYIVAVTRHDVDAALVFELLYKVVELGGAYLGGTMNEATVSKNLTVMYEILDEIIDFGYPQNTDRDTLRQFISKPASSGPALPSFNIMKSASAAEKRQQENSQVVSAQATSATSWRRAGIKYRRNEVFLDVLEKVNLVQGAGGQVIKADVTGQIQVRSHLSGMPECHIGLNDHAGASASPDAEDRSLAPVTAQGIAHLEDFQLHQSVELALFNRTHDIMFVPPDGEFELMRYRAVRDIKLPFAVRARVDELDKTVVEYNLTLRADFDRKVSASAVTISVPVPPNAHKTAPKVSSGKVKYNPGKHTFEWTLSRLSGGSEATLTGRAELTPTTSGVPWSRPPINVNFSLNMFSSSGLNIRYLKVLERSNYATLKWVRYLSEGGSYEIRI